MTLASMTALAANEWLAGLNMRIQECVKQDLPCGELEFLRDSLAWQLTDKSRYTLNRHGQLCIKLEQSTGF